MAISGGDGSIILTTKVDESGLSKGLSKLKSGIGAFGKAFAVAGAAGVVAFAGITKAAVDSYAEFEQLKGGVETLFKDSAGQLMKYADQAYKTAGLSANEYMATVTSFSASLLQSLGGDTEKAANYADQAIIDMSDNANKMGTSMEMIQNAYQGFAKQNYTMLDNLKLGYGGTKEEMQRLLDDAQKISGIKYDISSFADVTQAIHVIQTELGITGTTALEASSTIQGSASAMKASWQNLLTGMADPTQDFNVLLQNFISSIGTFAGNLLPVITTATQGVLQMVQGLLPQIPVLIEQMLPIVIEGVSGIISGLVGILPQIVNAVMEILPQLVTAILNMLPQILEAGIQILLSLIQGLTQALPQLIAMLPEIINTIITVLIENLPLIIEAGVQLLMAVIEGLAQAIPQLIDYIPSIIETIITVLLDNLPMLIDCAIQLMIAIINGLMQSTSKLAAMVPEIIFTIVRTLVANLPQLLNAGKTLLTSIIDGIKSILSNMVTIGKNVVDGLWQGIQGAKNWLLNKIKQWCGSILNGIKAFFGIHSPSTVMRDEVGKMIPKGMAIGIDKAKNLVTKATKALVTDTRSEVQKVLDDMNEEMLESEKLYAEESLRIEREKEEAEYNEKLKAAKNAEERQKIENERAKKLQERADKEYLDNLKETAEKERKIYDARQKDVENAQKNIVNAYENAADDILDAIEDLQKRQQTLADKLFDFGDVMEDVVEIEDKFSNIHSPITEKDGRYVLENLGSQTWELESYLDLMTNLRDREGMSAEMFDVIKNMGYEESFAYAKKLMSMGDRQFSNYIESWQKKQETSKRVTEELFGDDGSVSAKRVLSDLADQTNVIKDYYSLLGQVKDRAELPEGFFDTLREMGIEEGLEYANALLELSDEDFANYINAWEEKQKTSQLISKELYKEEAEQLATEIGDKFDEVEKEFFDVGENAADQFESGFLEQLKTVVSNIKGTISGAFSNVGLGMSPNYGIGGYSINVPALARGSVLPGGKPFLAIVNDQPRGQTNVEAPLQTIVDAMNIALNNRGGSEIIREEHYNLNETELMTILHKLVKGGERLQGKSLISGGAY